MLVTSYSHVVALLLFSFDVPISLPSLFRDVAKRHTVPFFSLTRYFITHIITSDKVVTQLPISTNPSLPFSSFSSPYKPVFKVCQVKPKLAKQIKHSLLHRIVSNNYPDDTISFLHRLGFRGGPPRFQASQARYGHHNT